LQFEVVLENVVVENVAIEVENAAVEVGNV
jgi:hypothetical protein